jgi:regulatory protein
MTVMNARIRAGRPRRDPRDAGEAAQAGTRKPGTRKPGARKQGAPGAAGRGPAPATPERLEAAALRYLERFAASSAHLRRLLIAKVRRSARRHGTDEAALTAFVADLVERLAGAGILDDRRYAEGKAMTLRRRGASSRQIRAALAAKGIAGEEAQAALAAADAERVHEDGDLDAARRLARRRRLGPWRRRERARHRSKDLAALGRAGFTLDIARAVIDGSAAED